MDSNVAHSSHDTDTSHATCDAYARHSRDTSIDGYHARKHSKKKSDYAIEEEANGLLWAMMTRESKLRHERQKRDSEFLENMLHEIGELRRMFVDNNKEFEDVVYHIGEENVTSVNKSKVEDVECFKQPFLSLNSNVSSFEITNHFHSQVLSPFKV